MLKRNSKVNHISINALSFASILQLGDSEIVSSDSKTIAIQRKEEMFFGQEGDFNSFSFFTEPIILWDIEEPLFIKRNNASGVIFTNRLDILGASTAVIIHVGTNHHIYLKSRIKHIRQIGDIDQ